MQTSWWLHELWQCFWLFVGGMWGFVCIIALTQHVTWKEMIFSLVWGGLQAELHHCGLNSVLNLALFWILCLYSDH
jgi:hypothetical protein